MALSVAEALAKILEEARPLGRETVSVADAAGRVLAQPLIARMTQPPFDASAMDGYAVRSSDVAQLPASLKLIGESGAGHPFAGRLEAEQTVRIFTGAPMPEGADAVVIQENTIRDGATVTVREGRAGHVRTRGFDFREGDALLAAGTRLGPREIALAAAMGYGEIPVHTRPVVAVLSTGDELVPPGQRPGPGQIIASNHLAIAALAAQTGATPVLLGIARDTRESLREHIDRARDADVLVTIGGASVGDHDLVGPVLREHGMALAFWQIAMRPGKPLMFGRLGAQRVMGLPGNPVSSIICSRVFLVPLVRALAGLPTQDPAVRRGRLAVAIEANGPRQHYMRATLIDEARGAVIIPSRSQDSSLLAPLASANCLIVRGPHAEALPADSELDVLLLDF
jgi:molybdopterin molybdotransferase